MAVSAGTVVLAGTDWPCTRPACPRGGGPPASVKVTLVAPALEQVRGLLLRLADHVGDGDLADADGHRDRRARLAHLASGGGLLAEHGADLGGVGRRLFGDAEAARVSRPPFDRSAATAWSRVWFCRLGITIRLLLEIVRVTGVPSGIGAPTCWSIAMT